MSVSLVPINYESNPGVSWGGSGGGNQLFAGAHLYNGNLYVVAQSWSFPGPTTAYYAEIWKSTDSGLTWTLLPLETHLSPSEWNYTWDYFWNDTVNKLTFMMEQTGRLVDFDLTTETWSAVYGGNFGSIPTGETRVIDSGRLVRLSDGRVLVFYTGMNAAVRGELCWAVANTSGSGLWDSKDTVAATAGAPKSVCADSTNRTHCIYSVATSPGHWTDYYINLSSSYALSAATQVPGGDYSEGNIIAAPDGKLYYSYLYPNTTPDYTVDAWVGSNQTNPAWTQEVVVDYGPSGNPYPAWAFLAWISGSLYYFWQEFRSSYQSVWYSQRSSTGTWSTKALVVDLSVTSPPAPINDQGFGYWSNVGISAGAVASGISGLGVILAIEVGLPDGTQGEMAFYVSGTSSPPTLSLACPTGTATVGTAYSGTLTVSGGTAPYTFAVTSGPLPPGLTLNTSTGVISGTPTTAGSYPYSVKVTDSSGVTATGIVTCNLGVSRPSPPPNASNVEFTLRRVYVTMVPNKRISVRGH